MNNLSKIKPVEGMTLFEFIQTFNTVNGLSMRQLAKLLDISSVTLLKIKNKKPTTKIYNKLLICIDGSAYDLISLPITKQGDSYE